MSDAIRFFSNKLEHETDSWDLQQALAAGESVVVIDVRSREAFEAEHIPLAINLPHREMNEATTSHLDRSRAYVTYCDGIGCNASTKGALRMSQLGFHARELMGGLDWWKRDGHPTQRSTIELL